VRQSVARYSAALAYRDAMTSLWEVSERETGITFDAL